MLLFDNAEYADEIFKKENLSQKVLKSVEFLDCQFDDCNLAEASFSGCEFKGCKFKKCNMSLMKVVDCTFVNSTFEDSKIIGVNWTLIQWPKVRAFSPMSFLRCDISLSTFIGQDLHEIVIKECKACDVDFRETNLTKANLSGSDLSQCQFYQTNLSQADFRGAKNYNLDIYSNKITGAKFTLPEALSLLTAMDIELE